MSGIKQLKAWFFAITSEVRADGTTGGVRLRKTDKPTQQTFENLLQSTTFSTESSDRAKVSTGATLASEQGLSVLASDVQAKANASQLSDRSLVVQPHQLPTVENLDVTPIQDEPASTTTVDTGSASTRNQFRIKLSTTWRTWLVSRIFKQGGVLGDVPIKNSGTNYDWDYGNVGNDTTTVTNIANNATFVSTLLANSTFVTNITNTIISSNPAAITEALEVGFMRVHPVTSMPSSKWLRCDGGAISRTTYSSLFALIGTTYGVGDGSTTFNIPDLRDKQITGYSGTKTIGSTAGTETHQISTANLPPHTHDSGTLVAANDSHHHNFSEVAFGGGVVNTDRMIEGKAYNAAPGADLIEYLQPTLISTPTIVHAIEIANDTHNHTINGDTGNGGFANTLINHLDPYLATNIIIKVLP